MRETLVAFTAADGLRLSARDWAGPDASAPAVLCLHGLTRNSRDFQPLAEALQSQFRVIAPDQRGRGRSAYDPQPAHYNVLVQAQDTWALMDQLGVDRFAIVGTSMGALMAVTMANQQPQRIASVVLNDAGPEVDPRGLARIAGYVGRGGSTADWEDAARQLAEVHGAAYPDYAEADWLRMAHATYVEGDGGLRLDYDPDLKQAFAVASGVAPDLWPAFEALKSIPTLVLRGALSDILSAETAEAMGRRLGARVVTVPRRGHAPDLSEPASISAVQEHLAGSR
jgi:pimeloyl-ACP methyl ester carboxylesterase